MPYLGLTKTSPNLQGKVDASTETERENGKHLRVSPLVNARPRVRVDSAGKSVDRKTKVEKQARDTLTGV